MISPVYSPASEWVQALVWEGRPKQSPVYTLSWGDGAESPGRPKWGKLTGPIPGEKRAVQSEKCGELQGIPSSIWQSTNQRICMRKLPKARKKTPKMIKGHSKCANTGPGIVLLSPARKEELTILRALSSILRKTLPQWCRVGNQLQTEHCSGITSQIIKARPQRITLLPNNYPQIKLKVKCSVSNNDH